MKRYIGVKLLSAKPMTHGEAVDDHKIPQGESIDHDEEGYLVKYTDDYYSWSPKDVFESAYQECPQYENNIIGDKQAEEFPSLGQVKSYNHAVVGVDGLTEFINGDRFKNLSPSLKRSKQKERLALTMYRDCIADQMRLSEIDIRPVEDDTVGPSDERDQLTWPGTNMVLPAGVESDDVSDTYHTFGELYDFRQMYNAGMFNMLASTDTCEVHKSTKHFDGEDCFGGGWFVVVAILPDGQISNHYEMKDWDLFHCESVEKAKYEFDGHTPTDVLDRLKSFAMSFNGVVGVKESDITAVHRPVDMSFGLAINELSSGKKVARSGWNGKGMWLAIQEGSTISKEQARGGVAKLVADGGAEEIVINSHIDMKTADGSITIGWAPSQLDMLADDWLVVE
jgi:hypothetical protein